MLKTIQSLPADIRRFCWLAAGYQFFVFAAFFFAALSVILDTWGLTAWQITSLWSVFFISKLLAELPSSILADRFSRRNLLIAAECLGLVAIISFLAFPNYLGGVCGMALWGVGRAFYSGTFSAYLYDELKLHKQESLYLEASAFVSSTLYLGLIFASSGAYLYYEFGYAFVFYLSFISKIIGLCVLCCMPELGQIKDIKNESFKNIIIYSFKTFMSTPGVFWLFFVSGGMLSAEFFLEYRAKILADMGFSINLISVFVCLFGLVHFLGVFLSGRFNLSQHKIFIGWGVVVCLLFVIFAVSSMFLPMFALFFWFVGVLLYEVWYMHAAAKRQESIPSSVRASVQSGGGILISTVFILSNNFLGYIAQETNSFAVACGLVMIIPLIFFAIYGVFGGKHRI